MLRYVAALILAVGSYAQTVGPVPGGGGSGSTTCATTNNLLKGSGLAGGCVDSGILPAAVALLASPTFTGVPAAPTAAGGTNTTQLATTAFVAAATSSLTTCATTTNLLAGSGSAGGCVSSGIAPSAVVLGAASIPATQYLVPVASGTAGTLGISTLKLNGSTFFPTTDSTTAIKVTKADGTTGLAVIDTTNGRFMIGAATAPNNHLVVVGKSFLGPGVAALTCAVTVCIEDATATTGATKVSIISGPGQSGTNPLQVFQSDGTTSLFSVASNGLLTTSSITMGTGTIFRFSSSTTMNADSDGTIRFTNNAGNGFTLLRLGGTSSSFPALKRSSALIAVRLADDSADAQITSASGSIPATPTSTDPTCTAAGDIGKQWTDSTSATTTHFKICAEVASSPAWVTVF